MKVIVFGSRSWTDAEAIYQRLALLPPGTTIVHGKSPGGGADLLADVAARALGFTVIPVPITTADRHAAPTRRAAPIFRNMRMGREHSDAEFAVGFWDGVSPGSKNMRDVCLLHGIPVEIVSP